MSTNDDSASRRGRRADQGGSGWPTTSRRQRDEGRDQTPSGNRDAQSQQTAYSGFTRPSYTQRQEPQQPGRPYDPPPQQSYYQDPGPRQDYAPPSQSYEPPPPQHLGYGGGRDDLFTREHAAPSYDHNLYGGNASGYQQPYDQGQGRAADQDYYHREAPAPHQRPAQPYGSGGYDQHGGYDSRYEPQESWQGDEQGYHAREEQGRHLIPSHGDEFDQDFFGDEDDYEHDDLHGTQKRGGKKLLFAAVVAALAAGGGAYYLKSPHGGNKATPVIHADPKPSKAAPGNPGGKQFPNGDKSIYDRLRPDGTTQMASAIPAAAPAGPALATASPSAGNSLEDRIDEALRKVHRGADAPAGSAGSDQPTVVRSESYSPSGNRIESRPVITPTITDAGNGLPYPFGNAPAAAAPAPPPGAASFKVAAAPAQTPPAPPQFANTMAAPPTGTKGGRVRQASAEPPPAPSAPATAGGYYVSLKSAPDEKGIQRDLPALSKKYETVLGDVQLSTKIADLGAKGVTYRAVAGPLGTKQEAQDLCQKIKGVGGDKACFVTN